jgi:hypothetical protein
MVLPARLLFSKTAKALGLTVPDKLLALADEVATQHFGRFRSEADID